MQQNKLVCFYIQNIFLSSLKSESLIRANLNAALVLR
jgi:hypothetical protein